MILTVVSTLISDYSKQHHSPLHGTGIATMPSSELAKPQPAYRQHESEESMRHQTSLIFYEFLDEKTNDDSELTESERSCLHNSASSHIREICTRQAYGQEQVESTFVVASDLMKFSDEFNSYLVRDPELRMTVQSCMEDKHGQPNMESVIHHLSNVVMRVFECDKDGVGKWLGCTLCGGGAQILILCYACLHWLYSTRAMLCSVFLVIKI